MPWLQTPAVQTHLTSTVGADPGVVSALVTSAGDANTAFQNFNADPNLTTDAQRRDAMKAPPGTFLPQAVRGKVDYVVGDLYRTRNP